MAEKSLFQKYVECNKVSSNAKDLTGVKFDNFTVDEFVRREPPYFVWRCRCSCGATFDRSSKTINSHPDGHCGSVQNHSRWHDPKFVTEYFLRFFTQGAPDKCWEWKGNLTTSGYGRFRENNVLAHRFSYEHFNGPIPDGLHICHHCDNPPCVNPNHLYAGTVAENMSDKHRRGRHWPFALTTDDVRNIRAKMASGLKYGDIRDMAEEYGCDKSLLHLIKNNKIWKDVPWPDGYEQGSTRLLKGGTRKK